MQLRNLTFIKITPSNTMLRNKLQYNIWRGKLCRRNVFYYILICLKAMICLKFTALISFLEIELVYL